MIKKIHAKTLLATVSNAPDSAFGLYYNMNLYRGCQHGCIYCDSRSTCYQIENFSDILIKENAIDLLSKELRSKKKKGTIGTGSMNDPYMPVEAEIGLTRQALEVIRQFAFPVHILTKSTLVTRDLDLLQEIGRIYAAVSLTITAADDRLAEMIEPHAPSSSARFEAVQKLSQAGIYSGIILTPVLPYLTDSAENIGEIIRKGKEAGAKYVLSWLGMTLREGQREYYYRQLDQKFPGLKAKYQQHYQNAYQCPAPHYEQLAKVFYELCQKEGIATRMNFYQETPSKQLSLF